MTFFQLFLVFFAENKWFVPPWGCYLRNLATLVFSTFEIFKHWTFHKCLIWNVLKPPSWNLKRLNYTNIRCSFPKNSLYFTPWLLYLDFHKGLWQYFSQLLWSRIHLNVEISKLDWPEQVHILTTLLFLYFNAIDG